MRRIFSPAGSSSSRAHRSLPHCLSFVVMSVVTACPLICRIVGGASSYITWTLGVF